MNQQMFDKFANEKNLNPIGYMLARMALKQDDYMDELIQDMLDQIEETRSDENGDDDPEN